MKNNLYEELAKEKFNKEENYKKIIYRIKEEKYMEKKKNYKILNIAAIFMIAIIFVSAIPSVYAKIQWNIQFEEFKNREYEIGTGTIKDARESGYSEQIDMEYVTQDDISIKVDSLMMTDDYLESDINIKFLNNIEINSKTFGFSYAIYDENKNVYGVFRRHHQGERFDNYTSYIYKEIGVKYDRNDIYAIQLNDTCGQYNVSATDGNIITKLEMNTTKGFPKSKKLYIRVFDLGYTMAESEQMESFRVSDAEWIFEIDIPEKFYERQNVELILKDEIPELEIEKITVSEIGLIVRGKIEGIHVIFSNAGTREWQNIRNETVNITDEDGNIYYEKTLGTVQREDWFKMNFEINKNMLDKKLFLNVKINRQQYSSELVQK